MADQAQKEIYIAGDKPQPNVVDDYASYTYNITFSMLPQSFWYSGALPVGNKSKNKIIIAQTGVTTKFNIDNLTINTVNDNYGSNATSSLAYTTKATFDITEPLGSSLITLLHEGFHELKKMDLENGNKSQQLYDKKENMGPLDLMYLLEVDLIGHRGYADSGTDLFESFASDSILKIDEAGGEIFGKYAWPVYLTQFDFKPDHEGTRYLFEVVSTQNFIRKLPSSTRRTGEELELFSDTISGFINGVEGDPANGKGLIGHVNDNIMNTAKDLAGATAGRLGAKHNHTIDIKRGALVDMFGSDPEEWHKATDAIDPSHLTYDRTRLLTKAEEAAAKGEGSKEKTVKMAKITIKKNTPIKKALLDILSMNAVFCSHMSDYEFKMDSEVYKKHKKALDSTYSPNFHTTLQAKEHKTSTGGPAFFITYNLDIKEQAGVVTGKDGVEPTKAEEKKIIEQWGIIKKYDYIFSGLNDQVMDVDLSFPKGQIFMFPEYGGLTPTYRDSKATVKDSTDAELQETKSDKSIATTADVDVILDHFKQLQSDLKGAISQITEDGKDFLQGLKAQAALAKDPAGALKNLNGRLPSSPASVFHKIDAIKVGTEFFDGLYTDILDLQKNIEETAQDFAGGINLAGRVGQLVKDAATPFSFVTELNNGLESFSGGLDGFADSLGLSVNDIPGLSQVQDVVDRLDDLIDTPGGFGTGTIGGTGNFELTSLEISDPKNNYLEEFDFSVTSEFHGEEAFVESSVPAGANPQQKDDVGVNMKQHYMSTALSYSGSGIPYLVRLDLEIKGDPYWIGRENYVKTLAENDGKPISLLDTDGKVRRWKPEFLTDRSNKFGAAYDAGSLFLAFRYIFPKEYEHYHDDPAAHTGNMKFGGMDLSYSGYYMVVRTTHKFSQGMFKQDIEAIKMTTQPNKVVFGVAPEDLPPEEPTAGEVNYRFTEENRNLTILGNDLTNEQFASAADRIEYLKQEGYIQADMPEGVDFGRIYSKDYRETVNPIPIEGDEFSINFSLSDIRIKPPGSG